MNAKRYAKTKTSVLGVVRVHNKTHPASLNIQKDTVSVGILVGGLSGRVLHFISDYHVFT